MECNIVAPFRAEKPTVSLFSSHLPGVGIHINHHLLQLEASLTLAEKHTSLEM